jgi:hypothetical protein
MPAKPLPPQDLGREPIVLPKASGPLTPAHLALLELVAAKIVDDIFKENEGCEGEQP